jgi:hypothetical protein
MPQWNMGSWGKPTLIFNPGTRCGWIHDPAALPPGKEPPVSTQQQVGCTWQLVLYFQEEYLMPLQAIKSRFLSFPAHGLDTKSSMLSMDIINLTILTIF